MEIEPGNNSFSNIDIMGENEFNDQIVLATFYKQSNDTFGLTEILTNSTYLNKMKLRVTLRDNPVSSYSWHSGGETLQWKLDIAIYMDKDFLLNLYDSEKMPLFLFKIIKDNSDTYSNCKFNHNQLKTDNTFYSNNMLKKHIKENNMNIKKLIFNG